MKTVQITRQRRRTFSLAGLDLAEAHDAFAHTSAEVKEAAGAVIVNDTSLSTVKAALRTAGFRPLMGAETHPHCPTCGSDETRLTRNFGIPLKSGEQWCTKCGHQWVPPDEKEGAVSADSAVRARVAGREATAEQIVWALDVQGLRFRCVRQENGLFDVQVRTDKGWTETVAQGPDAAVLLVMVTTSAHVAKLLETT